MDLKSGYPWWTVRNGLLHQFPPLRADLRCDVAIVGGGISGALIADEFAAHGHSVALVERRDIGWGSTSASTALLQYEIDTPMTELARRYGEGDAVLAYQACVEAIGLLRAKAAEVRDVGCARADSLYYASKPRHAGPLRAEFELRARHGFAVEWLDADEVREAYGFDAPAAILSKVAARMDPYRMTYRLLARLQRRGTAVHDRTTVEDLQPHARGVTLRTGDGFRIDARHVVLAAGYETQRWLDDRVARNRSSYAFISDPLDQAALGPLATTLFWETARPYLYMRGSEDGRVLVGGADDAVDIPARRDRRVDAKSRKLLQQVLALFPELPIRPAFAWGGTFAETADGLPFFGAHPQAWGAGAVRDGLRRQRDRVQHARCRLAAGAGRAAAASARRPVRVCAHGPPTATLLISPAAEGRCRTTPR
jgi:glycine/D-amino acid oxidase-like deaminating enzyme